MFNHIGNSIRVLYLNRIRTKSLNAILINSQFEYLTQRENRIRIPIKINFRMIILSEYNSHILFTFQVELTNHKWILKHKQCTFPSSEMEKNEDFFSFSGRSVSEGGTLLPRVDFTAPSVARAVMKTRGSKVPPEDTLLSEKEEKSEVFYISDVGWYFLSFYSTLPHCLSVLGCSLTIF